MEINDLVKACHEVSKSKGFWDKERNVGEMLMLIVSELGEAIEAHRKNKFSKDKAYKMIFSVMNDEFIDKYEKEIKDTFEDEIADAFIRLFDLCGGLDIDIISNLLIKISYNQTRERLHGKEY